VVTALPSNDTPSAVAHFTKAGSERSATGILRVMLADGSPVVAVVLCLHHDEVGVELVAAQGMLLNRRVIGSRWYRREGNPLTSACSGSNDNSSGRWTTAANSANKASRRLRQRRQLPPRRRSARRTVAISVAARSTGSDVIAAVVAELAVSDVATVAGLTELVVGRAEVDDLDVDQATV
jgi:hypothetical protein